jgi:hypothetical protein
MFDSATASYKPYMGTQLIETLQFSSSSAVWQWALLWLVKILGVDTTLFLFNTQFYFPPSSPLVHKPQSDSNTETLNQNSNEQHIAEK